MMVKLIDGPYAGRVCLPILDGVAANDEVITLCGHVANDFGIEEVREPVTCPQCVRLGLGMLSMLRSARRSGWLVQGGQG